MDSSKPTRDLTAWDAVLIVSHVIVAVTSFANAFAGNWDIATYFAVCMVYGYLVIEERRPK